MSNEAIANSVSKICQFKSVKENLRRRKKPLHWRLPTVKTHYFTNCRPSTSASGEFKELLIKVPNDLEILTAKLKEKAWRKENLASKLIKPFTARIQNHHLNLKRPKSVDDQDYLRAYSQIFNGKTTKQRTTTRQYINSIREVFRNKISTGMKYDQIMQINEHLIDEKKQIETIKRNLSIYVQKFEELVHQGYSKAQEMDVIAKKEEANHQNINEKIAKVSLELSTVKSIIYGIEVTLAERCAYQKILTKLSPPIWRQKHYNGMDLTIYAVKSGLGINSDLDINQLEESMKNLPPCHLYFTDPKELSEMFLKIEQRNLDALLTLEQAEISVNSLQNVLVKAKNFYMTEINQLKEIINDLSVDIIQEEERAAELKMMCEMLLHGRLKNIMIDPRSLKISIWLSDLYNTFIKGTRGLSETPLEMAKAIENYTLNQLFSLDAFTYSDLKNMKDACHSKELREEKHALQAYNLIETLEKLFNKMDKIQSPPFKKMGKELKWRSPPKNPPLVKQIPKRSLTEREKEYLFYFTDYCPNTDDYKHYGIDLDKEPKTDFFGENR